MICRGSAGLTMTNAAGLTMTNAAGLIKTIERIFIWDLYYRVLLR